MPALNPLLVQAPVFEYYFVNKDDGTPLSAGYVTFYEDNNRTVLKPVYQLSQLPDKSYVYNELTNPLQLSSVGTFVDQNGNDIVIFLYPYQGLPTDMPPSGIVDLYYCQVFSSDNVFQWDRSAFPSGVTGSSVSSSNDTDNLLSNPQFGSVSFNGSVVLTVTGSPQITNIAPGWDLITNGTGTVTVTQVASSLTTIPSNPPYYLNISSSGLSNPIQLRQRLYDSPRLLVGDYLSGYFVVSSADDVTPVTLSYVASGGTPTNFPIVTITTTADGTWHDTTGLISTIVIDPSPISSDAPPAGYVDIILTIAKNVQVAISSVQIAGVTSLASTEGFLQQPIARQTDNLFHYYANSLLQQPKSSLLTGWNFGLNPWQFQTTTKTTITGNQYIADQTILIQQAYVNNATVTGNVASGQATFASNKALQLTAVTATSQFAIVQYIDPATIAPYWGLSLSALVNASITTVNSTSCNVKMRLIYNASWPNTVSQVDPISAWTAGDDPVFASGWMSIVPLNDPSYVLGATNQAFAFDSMQLPASTSATMTLGLVLYTTGNLSITGTPDSVQISKVSLARNDFAIETQPQTFDESLRACQYYYEKSYDNAVLPGTTNTFTGVLVANQTLSVLNGNSITSAYPTEFGFSYNTVKRGIPAVSLLDPSSGAGGTIQYIFFNNGVQLTNGPTSSNTGWATTNVSTKSVNFHPQSATPIYTSSSISLIGPNLCVEYQYTVDARLGR